MKSRTVKIAPWLPRVTWRCATALALLAVGGCAGSGPRAVPSAIAPPSGPTASTPPATDERDRPEATGGAAPTNEATAAELTRWSAACYREGRHAEAIERLSGWLAARADAPTAVRAALAVHHEALGQLAEAAAALAPCSADDVVAARARAWIALRGEGFASALDDAQRVVAAEPASAAARNNLGLALLYAGRPAEARAELLAARRLDPALPGAPYNLAIVESVYFFDDEAARRWLAEYRRLDHEDPDGLFASLGGEVAAATGAGPPAVASASGVLP